MNYLAQSIHHSTFDFSVSLSFSSLFSLPNFTASFSSPFLCRISLFYFSNLFFGKLSSLSLFSLPYFLLHDAALPRMPRICEQKESMSKMEGGER
jgi:hypothetical protein